MTRSLRGVSVVTVLWAVSGLVAPPARAQGHGHGPPPGHGKPGGSASEPGTSPEKGPGRGPRNNAVNAAAGVGPTGNAEFPVRNFGSWVDDAYVLPRGEAWVGVGAGYWRLPYASQLDAPMISGSIGLAERLHVSATLPVATVRYPDGFSTQRIGDAYISAKIGVRQANRGGVGIALAPLIEVLSDGSWPTADGGTIGRVHWALPVNLEYRATGWRTYGSAGYFSRGAVFGSGTLDIALGSRAGMLGLLSYTYSTRDPLVLSGVDVRRSRTDASAGGYLLPRRSVAVYALAGRTLSTIDDYASRFFLSGGVSFRVMGKPAP